MTFELTSAMLDLPPFQKRLLAGMLDKADRDRVLADLGHAGVCPALMAQFRAVSPQDCVRLGEALLAAGPGAVAAVNASAA